MAYLAHIMGAVLEVPALLRAESLPGCRILSVKP